MPTFDYKCLKCGEEFEMLQAPKAPSPKCLECGHEETQKLLSAPAVVFKGSGFYKTDSGSKSPTSTPKKDTADSKTKKEDVKKKTENNNKGDNKKS